MLILLRSRQCSCGYWRVDYYAFGCGVNQRNCGTCFKKPLLGSVTVYLPITTVKEVGNVITLNKSLLDLKKP
jgi:hypothetical protein